MNSSISWASLGSSSLPDPTFFLFVCRFFWLLVCQSYLSIHLFIHPIWWRWRAKRELIRTFRFCRQIALPHCSIMCRRHVQAAHEDVEVEILVFFTRCGQCSGQQIFYVPVGKAIVFFNASIKWRPCHISEVSPKKTSSQPKPSIWSILIINLKESE